MGVGLRYATANFKDRYIEGNMIDNLNHEIRRANDWSDWATGVMNDQQDKIQSLEKELSNWRSKYATAMTESKVMRGATHQLAKATGAYIKNFREMTGLSSAALDEKTNAFINELLELKRTNFNNARTADEVTGYLNHIIDRIPDLRRDITKAISTGLNNSAAIALNEKEYNRLMQSQKAYEETANLYRKLSDEYKSVISKANENVKQYNELVERYKNLKGGAEQYHEETKKILEQLDAENQKLTTENRDLSTENEALKKQVQALQNGQTL